MKAFNLSFAVCLSLLLSFKSFVYAQEDGMQPVVQAQLLVDQDAIQAGQQFWIAVELHMAEQWHVYWKNPGEAGVATMIDWQLPQGFSVGEIQWPAPSAFQEEGLVGLGYQDRVWFLAKVQAPADLPPDAVTLKARVRWVACKDACMPGSQDLTLTLPVGALLQGEALPAPSQAASLFEEAKKRLPQLHEDVTARFFSSQNQLALPLSEQQVSQGVHFYPESPDIVDLSQTQKVEIIEGKPHLLVSVTDNIRHQIEGGMEGIFLTANGQSFSSHIHLKPAFVPTLPAPSFSLPWIFLAAFLGGLLLNLMPCVLPVLSLKILEIIGADGTHTRKKSWLQGSVYATGVLVSFWSLAALLLILRSFGAHLGWGFQLQQPLFVMFLAALFTLMSLNFFGVFDIGTSFMRLQSLERKRGGYLKNFLGGALAVLVATPCSGPFLGTALGAALTLPWWLSLSVFTIMAFGMLLPFLAFIAFPKSRRFLPKPGPWMEPFKQIMGYALMATVLWLLWVLALQTGLGALFQVIIALFTLAFASWIWGRFGHIGRAPIVRRISLAVSIFLSGLALYPATQALQQKPRGQEVVLQDQWEPFSLKRLEELRAQGVPVFVDFTARWCLICQANHAVLSSAAVRQAFEEKGVVTMRADWTSQDPEITQALADQGRSAVPLYVLYKGQEKPVIFPQLLTSSIVASYLQ